MFFILFGRRLKSLGPKQEKDWSRRVFTCCRFETSFGSSATGPCRGFRRKDISMSFGARSFSIFHTCMMQYLSLRRCREYKLRTCNRSQQFMSDTSQILAVIDLCTASIAIISFQCVAPTVDRSTPALILQSYHRVVVSLSLNGRRKYGESSQHISQPP